MFVLSSTVVKILIRLTNGLDNPGFYEEIYSLIFVADVSDMSLLIVPDSWNVLLVLTA